MSYIPQIDGYLGRLGELLRKLDTDALDRFLQALNQARLEGRNIFIFGNGGSGATASHITGDWNKGYGWGDNKRFKVICLNDNAATVLAYGNDVSYDAIFVEQLKNFLQAGDMVIGISGSGNSKNVLRAIEYANAQGAVTVGLCGYDNGALEKIVRIAVHPHINDMQLLEDFHLIVGHLTLQTIIPRPE